MGWCAPQPQAARDAVDAAWLILGRICPVDIPELLFFFTVHPGQGAKVLFFFFDDLIEDTTFLSVHSCNAMNIVYSTLPSQP